MQSQTAVEPFVSIRELLAYSEEETQKWFNFFRENPQALDFKIGGRAHDVRGLVLHIVTVDYRYSQRLLAKEVTEFEYFRNGDLEQTAKWHEQSRAMLNEVLANMTPQGLDEVVVSKTRSLGDIAATKRKILVHMVLHGVRHWAQIATAVRQAGYETGMHDIIISEVMK